MVLNEYGFNFIEIPFTGSELFIEEFKINNRDLVYDESVVGGIEYYNATITKNPYLRASYIYKNGCKLRKSKKQKHQSFVEYFENNLNKWDYNKEDSGAIIAQIYYIEKDINSTEIFKYEELIDNWQPINILLTDLGLSKIQVFQESDYIKDWKKNYEDTKAIELINYIFEEDFEKLNYSKLL